MNIHLKNILLLLIVLFVSCSDGQRELPELKGVEAEVTFHHFYRIYPGEPGYMKDDSIPGLYKRFPLFSDLFNRYVISIGGPERKDFLIMVNAFCSDQMIRKAYDDCARVHGDLIATEKDFRRAFAYFSHYFPGKMIPDVYFFQSGFNQSLIVDSAILGIAIDKYLGSEYEYYIKLGLPRYQRMKMTSAMMLPDGMMAWTEGEFPLSDSCNNMLCRMIYYGKLQYCLERVIPWTHDTLLFAFSGQQWEWCVENEKKMWAWLLENKMLFSTDQKEIRRFTEDGPFTAQFSKDSPARTGVWLGWRIVHRYMEKNPSVTLSQLMNNQDSQAILSLSGYNP
jgi:hypothetical protein